MVFLTNIDATAGNKSVSNLSNFKYLLLCMNMGGSPTRLVNHAICPVDFFKKATATFGSLYWNDTTGIGWSGVDLKYINDTTIYSSGSDGMWHYSLYGIK